MFYSILQHLISPILSSKSCGKHARYQGIWELVPSLLGKQMNKWPTPNQDKKHARNIPDVWHGVGEEIVWGTKVITGKDSGKRRGVFQAHRRKMHPRQRHSWRHKDWVEWVWAPQVVWCGWRRVPALSAVGRASVEQLCESCRAFVSPLSYSCNDLYLNTFLIFWL